MNRLTQTDRYQNILVIATGFTLLWLAFGWMPLLLVAIAVAVIGLVSGWLSDRVIYGWMKLGHALGYVNSRIVLSVIFIAVLTPVAVIYRITRKKEAFTGSYLVTRNHTYQPKDLEKGW